MVADAYCLECTVSLTFFPFMLAHSHARKITKLEGWTLVHPFKLKLLLLNKVQWVENEYASECFPEITTAK